MRVMQRVAVPSARKRLLGEDRRGNLQIIETMVVGLLVIGAVVAVSTMDVPVTKTEAFKQNNERLVQDSLSALYNHPSESTDAKFGSLLEEYVMEAAAGNQAPLMRYLNKTLPTGAQYNVYLDNGYGPPLTLVSRGAPPREAVAGQLPFVPTLAYTFMVTDFASYHGDFDMGVHAIPIRHASIQQDEGTSIEVAVTFTEGEEEPVTLRTYGHTALRFNDPNAREWPSVSIYHDTATPSYYVDATGAAAADPARMQEALGLLYAQFGAATIEFPIAIEETADVPVPKGTQYHLILPRGWDFDASEQDYFANQDDWTTGPGNAKFWKDVTFEGGVAEGWHVTGTLKDEFRHGKIWLNVSAYHGTVVDTASPYFTHAKLYMGNGVQGMSTIVIEPPGNFNAVGALKRDLFVSTSKPLISDDFGTWGVAITNRGAAGQSMKISSIEIRQPDDLPIIKDISERGEWVAGTWNRVGTDTHWKWTPDAAGGTATVATGGEAWLSFSVRGGYTQDNSYRNQDYMGMISRFNPHNNTGGQSDIGTWEYVKNSYDMSEEWVYHTKVVPSDFGGDQYYPGWADEVGKTYWVTGEGSMLNYLMPGNLSYGVALDGVASNTFGDYQGAHVFSTLDLVDKDLRAQREFGINETVYVQNDFSAVFGELSGVNSLADVQVSNLQIKSFIYTPERAWKGLPSTTFTESADLVVALDDVKFLEGADINGDGVQDLLAVDDGGRVYALDGRDGAKFWTYDTDGATYSTALADFDLDGQPELMLGQVDKVVALDTRVNLAGTPRILWAEIVKPSQVVGIGAYKVLAMEVLAEGQSGKAELAVAVSSDLLDMRVNGLDMTKTAGVWDAAKVVEYRGRDYNRSTDMSVGVLESVRWGVADDQPATHFAVGSDNMTVMLLDAATFEAVWLSDLAHKPWSLHVADLDQDGMDDVVVDTYDGGSATDGTHVYVLEDDSGAWGSKLRPNDMPENVLVPREAIATLDGGFFGVTGAAYILNDNSGLYTATPSVPSMDPPLPTDLLLSWTGQDVVDGDVFIITSDGELRKTHQWAPTGGYEWEAVHGMLDLGLNIMDLHVEKDYASGGRIYYMQDTGGTLGKISYSDDVGADRTDVAVLCGGIVHACDLNTDLVEWEVAEDASGDPTAILALVREPGEGSYLYSFAPASMSWSTVGTFVGVELADLFIDDGTKLWVAGNDLSGAPYVASQPLAGGGWTKQTVLSPDASDELSSIVRTAAGEGWISSNGGRAWRAAPGSTTWVPFLAEDFDSDAGTHLVVDLEDRAWLLGEDFRVAPLFTYDTTDAWAYFPRVLDGAIGFAPTKLRFNVTEGHLAGTDGVDTYTAIQWQYRIGPATAWTDIPMERQNQGNQLYDVDYEVAVSCPTEEACHGVELRARLMNRLMSQEPAPIRQDPSGAPLIRDIVVTYRSGLTQWSDQALITNTSASLQPGSTAVYSQALAGFTLPVKDVTHWGYIGVSSSHEDKSLFSRAVGVSKNSLIDGSAGPDVVIMENTTAPTGTSWVLNGVDGQIERPTSSGIDPLSHANDDVDSILIADADGDGIEDVIYVGLAGATSRLGTSVWILDDELHLKANNDDDGSDRAYALIDTGIQKQRQSFAYIGDKGVVSSLQAETQNASPPTVEWTTVPATAQGLATFQYDIPDNAMFGTAVVVSELVFDVTSLSDAQTVTQTARLLDWFNITPPGESVPRPPVYTVEIVSWFNEA